MNSEDGARQIADDLAKEYPEHGIGGATYLMYLDYYQFFGSTEDDSPGEIKLGNKSIPAITPDCDVGGAIYEMFGSVASNFLWGPELLPLSSAAMAKKSIRDERSCLEPTWLAQVVLAAYAQKHGVDTEEDRRILAYMADTMAATSKVSTMHCQVADFLAVNRRDVALFNLHQQHGILDGRGWLPCHPHASIARHLLKQRGVWDLLRLMLLIQVHDEESWLAKGETLQMATTPAELAPLLA